MIWEEYENLISIREELLKQINEQIKTQPFSELEMNCLTGIDKQIGETRKRLRQSRDMFDKVYRMRFLDCLRVEKIAITLHYDQSSVYRILRKIGKKRKDAKKCQ